MTTRRQFLKQTGLVALAGALGCEGSSETAEPGPDAEGGDAKVGEGDTAQSTEDAPVPEDAPDVGPELPTYEHEGPLGPETLFQHGVASGDPLPDRVILWTRCTSGGSAAVPVFWELATDPAFASRVAADWTEATEAADFTVKVDATGLSPGRYYYRFQALGRTSTVGQTRLPVAPDTAPGSVRFAVASCADYSAGRYHAYRDIAAQDLDAVVFLGDYIYEYGNGPNEARPVAPDHEIVSLADYRTRYGHYRTDPDLQAAHQAHPWIVVWDDHEIANNSWRRGDSHGDTGDVYAARLAAATQAWREWLPVRVATDEPIYRRFVFGDLVHLAMLDTRIVGRDEPAEPNAPEGFDAQGRQLLGAAQEAWLLGEMTQAQSAGRWLVLGQQIMVAPLTDGAAPINFDQWDGYPAARERLFSALAEAKVADLVVLTGDIHSSWASDIPRDASTYDPESGDGAVGVEFVAPGITSGFPLDVPELVDFAKLVNPHVKYADVARRGYVLLDIDPDRAEATWRYAVDVLGEDPTVEVGAEAVCQRGARRLSVA